MAGRRDVVPGARELERRWAPHVQGSLPASLSMPSTVIPAAFISQSARNSKGVPDGPRRSNHEDATKKKKLGGRYTRVLAFFALGIPVGWAIRDLNRDEGAARPTDFVQYTLTGREPISSTCSIFTFKPASSSAIDIDQLHAAHAITSVQFKQPQLQIARSYTVLPPMEGQAPDELRFLIRKEQRGEVSGYLHRLPTGAAVEMRGPNVEYTLPQNVTEVVFLAGGTGIAPALQVANALAGHGRVRILWANRKREDCVGGSSDTQAAAAAGSSLFSWWSTSTTKPMPEPNLPDKLLDTGAHPVVKQIDDMKRRPSSVAHGGLLVDYFVDEEGSLVRPTDVTRSLESVSTTQQTGARLLLVSGPEGFVNYWAGPKEWIGGREQQGPLGGALAILDLHGCQVIKL
ncbi:hypothetical protein LTR53_005080 [Teratosphaeriaceae sp. CCFEE 6253]|nr:hypothetical protein LTR53_005080 [Teratosphaeriaceae sp. CCFEE 6253]